MVEVLIYIAVVAIIAGLIAFVVRSAPFVEEPFKSIAVWAIVAVAIILIVLKLSGVAGIDMG